MISRKARRPDWLAVGIIVFAATGCAVLTIDVDVYKGPLANDESIQMQQMLSLATAAQPMLVELRDRLEWGAYIEKGREKAIAAGWYVEGHVPDPRLACNADCIANGASARACATCGTVGGTMVFRRPPARRVNSILSLYEDQRPTAMDRLQDQFVELRAGFGKQTETFAGSPGSDESLAEEIRRKATGASEALAVFLERKGHLEIKALVAAGAGDLKGTAGDLRERATADTPQISTNEVYLRLSEPGVISAFVESWLPSMNDTALHRKVVSRLEDISNAYIAARQSLRDLLAVALDLLPRAEEEAALRHVVSELAEVIASLIEPRFLVWAADTDLLDPPKQMRLRSLLEEELVFGSLSLNREGPMSFEVFRARLAHSLKRDPRGVCGLLAVLHGKFAAAETVAATIPTSAQDMPLLGRPWSYFADRYRRSFGITTYPEFVDSGESSVGFVGIEDLRSYRAESSVGLGQGRLPDGIQSLIDDYLKIETNGGNPVVRERLVDALVRFSQKILFLANNEELLNPPSPPALVPSVLYLLWHHLLGGTWVEKQITSGPSAFHHSGVSVPEGQKNYVSVLQAVGNSILVQADEYRKDLEWYRAQVDRTRAEEFAAMQALATNGSEFLAMLTEILKEKLARLEVARGVSAIVQTHVNSSAVSPDTGPTLVDYDRTSGADDASRAIDDLRTTLKFVEDYRETLTDSERDTASMESLLSCCRERAETVDDQTRANLQVAARVLTEQSFSIPRVDRPLLADAKRPVDVLDLMAGALQHEYIQALLRGADEETLNRLDRAHARTLERRASLIRIRPASAFLRTSYPSTALQGDPGLGWSNRLESQGFRSVPILGSVLGFLVPDQFPDEAIQAGIDKQFWQNVNRVRVAGTGKSNFVITKDDIGNWYVKSYEADPDEVMKSALGLATLAGDHRASSDALRPLFGRPTESAGVGSTLDRLSVRQEREYLEAVAETLFELREQLRVDGHADRARQTLAKATGIEPDAAPWREELGAATSYLDDALLAASNPIDLDNESKDDDQAIGYVVESLEGILRFHHALDEVLQRHADDAARTWEAARQETEVARASRIAAQQLAEDRKQAADSAWEAVLRRRTENASDSQVRMAEDVHAQAREAVRLAEQELASKEAQAKSKLERLEEARAAKSQAALARAKASELGRIVIGESIATLQQASEKYQEALDFLAEGRAL